MQALKICLMGGSGQVGHALIPELLARGHRVRIVSRRPARHRDLLVWPGVTLAGADVHRPDQLREQFQDMDAVVNLVGILNERGHRGRGFEHVHVELAEKIVSACRHAGVSRLLHMSALNADPRGPSHYLRSKGRAEQRVHEAAGPDLAVTSFRPSVIFGPADSFLNRFAGLLRRMPAVFPLARPRTRFQPVYVRDVARAMARALAEPATVGGRYELCGPKRYTLQQLVAYVAELCRLRRHILGLPDWLSWLQAATMEFVPGKPFSLDNYRSLSRDSVCGGPFPAVFGITPTPLEQVAPLYLCADPAGRFSALRRRAGRR